MIGVPAALVQADDIRPVGGIECGRLRSVPPRALRIAAALSSARTIAVRPAYSVDKSADGIGRLNRPTLDTSLPLLLTVVNIENGARLL